MAARRDQDASPIARRSPLDHFEADSVVRASLGPIADLFLALKRDEWREYHAQVGPWEIQRYLTAL